MSAPPAIDAHVVVACSTEAAARYRIPAHVLLAVATQEAGRPGQRVKNANGSADIGTLQFNTQYIRTLARFGIKEAHVAAPGCYPFHLAAWRIRGHLVHDTGDFWVRVANYHSRTPHVNEAYRKKLIVRSAEWTDWLQRSASPVTSMQQKHIEGARSPGGYVPRTVTASPR